MLADMIDEFAKKYLHDDLREARTGVVGKLHGLPEYDVRRPLTRTGTNLLGLVKHLTLSEARYFGAIFNRPYPEPIPTFDDPRFENRDHMWVTERESRATSSSHTSGRASTPTRRSRHCRSTHRGTCRGGPSRTSSCSMSWSTS